MQKAQAWSQRRQFFMHLDVGFLSQEDIQLMKKQKQSQC